MRLEQLTLKPTSRTCSRLLDKRFRYLRTLHESPPVVYAKQANFAHGPQQVNNAITMPSRSGEMEVTPNELLKVSDEQRMDAGAPGKTIVSDTPMETVDVRNRAHEQGRGKGR